MCVWKYWKLGYGSAATTYGVIKERRYLRSQQNKLSRFFKLLLYYNTYKDFKLLKVLCSCFCNPSQSSKQQRPIPHNGKTVANMEENILLKKVGKK